jgi:hypothetical protein
MANLRKADNLGSSRRTVDPRRNLANTLRQYAERQSKMERSSRYRPDSASGPVLNDAIIIAIIGLVGTIVAGIPAVLIQRAREENNFDHAIVQNRLKGLLNAVGEVSEQVEKIDDKLEEHLKDHLDS